MYPCFHSFISFLLINLAIINIYPQQSKYFLGVGGIYSFEKPVLQATDLTGMQRSAIGNRLYELSLTRFCGETFSAGIGYKLGTYYFPFPIPGVASSAIGFKGRLSSRYRVEELPVYFHYYPLSVLKQFSAGLSIGMAYRQITANNQLISIIHFVKDDSITTSNDVTTARGLSIKPGILLTYRFGSGWHFNLSGTWNFRAINPEYSMDIAVFDSTGAMIKQAKMLPARSAFHVGLSLHIPILGGRKKKTDDPEKPVTEPASLHPPGAGHLQTYR